MRQILRPAFLFVVSMMLALSGHVAATGQSETKLLALARDSAIIAGGARYCQLDSEAVEEFIVRAEARLTVLAADEYEKILARLEFKNILDTYTVRAPDQPCEEFALMFERARQSLR